MVSDDPKSSFAKHLLAPLAFIPRAWPSTCQSGVRVQSPNQNKGDMLWTWRWPSRIANIVSWKIRLLVVVKSMFFWCWKSVISMQLCLFTQWYLPHFHCFSKQRFCTLSWRNGAIVSSRVPCERIFGTLEKSWHSQVWRDVFFTFRKERKLATRISSQKKNKISPKPLVFELNFWLIFQLVC